MICKICGNQSNFIFSAKILNKYNIKYFNCPQCGFLQVEEPFWLQEAYAQPINISDTGYLQRNIGLSKTTSAILTLFFNHKEKFLDYAGGYGVFVRLMRDIGFDFYWQDKYTQNLFARGFEWNSTDEVEAVTTFESFEHFVQPMEEMKKLLTISKNIIFTTELLPDPIPKPNEWWYYGLDHGQHISFYSERTLKFIAEKYSLNYLHHGNIHIFTEKKNIHQMFLRLVIKLNHFGLYKVLARKVKSKTWEDHLAIADGKEKH